MQQGKYRQHINQAMQLLPAFAAQPTNSRVKGCQGQRQHKNKTQHSQPYKRPFHQVFGYLVDFKVLVKPDVAQQMQYRIHKARHAGAAPKPQQHRCLQ